MSARRKLLAARKYEFKISNGVGLVSERQERWYVIITGKAIVEL